MYSAFYYKCLLYCLRKLIHNNDEEYDWKPENSMTGQIRKYVKPVVPDLNTFYRYNGRITKGYPAMFGGHEGPGIVFRTSNMLNMCFTLEPNPQPSISYHF